MDLPWHDIMKSIIPACAAALLLFISTPAARKSRSCRTEKIAGMVFQEDQFFRLVLFGMRDAASRGGADLLEANSEGKPDKEIQLINTYIASGVDAIVVSR